ncbi:MAG: hypothetical protein WCJ33_07220 [Pseudomonadota bacterium]
MNKGFRLGLFLCGLINADSTVPSYADSIVPQHSTVNAVLAVHQIRADQDCSTGRTPDKPTPSPKTRETGRDCDDFMFPFEESKMVRELSFCDMLPVPIIPQPEVSSVSSPTSTHGQFNSANTSSSVTPALTFSVSVSPSTSSLQDLALGGAVDCPTGRTPDKPTPSPKHPSSPKK